MSITYEEALSTLESMFGAPWDREVLDLILRHFQGHMENTVEAILAHGDQAPALLVQTLNNSTKTNATAATTQRPPTTNREAQDSMLAQQLAAEERHQLAAAAGAGAQQQQQHTSPAGRGLPTELPADFLRIPGYTSSSATSTTSSIMDQDEALARMLQDELFSQELANNPEFAHLVNGGAAGGRNRNSRTTTVPHGSNMQYPSRLRTAGSAGGNNSNTAAAGPPIMDHIAELGQDAKKRLQLFAAQWNNGVNQIASRLAGNTPSAAGGGMTNTTGSSSGGGIPQNRAAANETRGLLDGNDDDDDGEEMEMSFTPTNAPSTKTKHQ